MTETKSSPSPTPKGPRVEMNEEAVLAFLENEMRDPKKFNSLQHIIKSGGRRFRLIGREEAIKEAATCMQVFSRPSSVTDKEVRRIPVCSGLSGLGKTRMLEEWNAIFDKARIGPHRLGILVPYIHGFSITPVENSMNIGASLSWRLLYRCFLFNNSVIFTKWMQTRLPSNAAEMNLQLALEVIRKKWGQLNPLIRNEVLHIFVGIDEYQVINDIVGNREKQPPLQDLIDALSVVLDSPNSNFKLYPMMAGTDVSAASVLSCSKTLTERMPMTLLSFADVENMISSVENGDLLLKKAPVRRHLLYLGGVPRWIVLYASPLIEALTAKRKLDLDDYDAVFEDIKELYADKLLQPLKKQDIIKLAAYSLSGCTVNEYESPVASTPWSKLRDKSVCILNRDKKVVVPYSVLLYLATLDLNAIDDEPSKCLIKCIKGLIEDVDDQVCEEPLWRLWEKFGAYFHALRINALLVIGKNIVKVDDLFKDALINCSVTESLVLKPTLVAKSLDTLDSCKSPEIRLIGHQSETRNWTNEGIIVLNGHSGRGVDVFFAVRTISGKSVVFLDQRKRAADSELSIESVKSLMDHGRLKLDFLPKDSVVVTCLFQCMVSSGVQSKHLPPESIFVSKKNFEKYHGSLFTHPAAAPFIDIRTIVLPISRCF
jgi:hypothetical protein